MRRVAKAIGAGAETVVAGLLAASSADLSRRAAATGPGKAGVLGLYATWCTFTTALTARLATPNKGRG
jgi:hypothetical protein